MVGIISDDDLVCYLVLHRVHIIFQEQRSSYSAHKVLQNLQCILYNHTF